MRRKQPKVFEENPNYSLFFLLSTILFLTALLTANIIAVKIISIFGVTVPAGIIIFPISYILGDVITEVYGYGRARTVIWLGFFANFLFVLAVMVTQALPPAPFWGNQIAFEKILGYTPRLLAASFSGYFAGEFSNSFVLAKMKIFTKGKWLWTRTIGSTLIGEGIDSLIFISLAFWGTIPTTILLSMILTQWLLKTGYETIVTPLTYIIVSFLKQKEKIDVFDHKTDFSPLKI